MSKVETVGANIQFKLFWSTEARNAQWIADMFTRVHTTCEVQVNAIFGPCELKHTSVYDSIAFIALKSMDRRTAPYVLRVDTSIRTGATGPTWLRTVQSARCSREQNLEAYVKNGELFYRALKRIERGEELLVWYSGDLAMLLHLDNPQADKGAAPNRCKTCNMMFESVFPLLAHQRFLCPKRNTQLNQPCKPGEKDYKSDSLPLFAYKLNTTDHGKPITDFHNLARDIEEKTGVSTREAEGGIKRKHFISENEKDVSNNKKKKDHGRNCDLPSNYFKHKSLNKEHGDIDKIQLLSLLPSLSFKRDIERKREEPMDGMALSNDTQGPEDLRTNIQNHRYGPSSSPVRKVKSSSQVCRDETLSPSSDEKVNSSRDTPISIVDTAGVSGNQSVFIKPADSRFNALLLAYHTNVLRNPISATEHRNVQSDTLFEGSQSVGVPSSSSLRPAPLVIKPKPTKRSPTVQPLSSTMHGQANLFCSLAATWYKKTPPTTLSLQKSQRQIHSVPLSSSVSSPGLLRLPSSLPPLSRLGLQAQNWCAKCNVSFRLTAELVHHMRSHHTGVPCEDLGVKGSDKGDRYRCTVCTEVFKQRHHLARHLAAHT